MAWRIWALRRQAPGVLYSALAPFAPREQPAWDAGGWQRPAWCAFHAGHDAPDPGCRCGWRGEPSLAELAWWLTSVKGIVPRVIGRVELGGRIITGDPAHPEIPRIRRAGLIRVAGPLYVAPGMAARADGLAARYGVGVRLWTGGPAASWAGAAAARLAAEFGTPSALTDVNR